VADTLTLGNTGSYRYFGLPPVPGGDGTYILQGGGLQAAAEIIGNQGTGTFTQSAGSNTISGNLSLGVKGSSIILLKSISAGSGTYNLQWGRLQANDEIIGDAGNGIFTQSGNSYNTIANGLTLAVQSSSTAQYNLQLGTLQADTEIIGDGGKGRSRRAVDTRVSAPIPFDCSTWVSAREVWVSITLIMAVFLGAISMPPMKSLATPAQALSPKLAATHLI